MHSSQRGRLDEATREWEELTIELDEVSTRERNLVLNIARTSKAGWPT